MRTFLLKAHLCLGLSSGIFIMFLGLTGTVMALQDDIEHWLHPGLWYVTAGPRALPEGDLIDNVQSRFSPARVRGVQVFRQANLVQVMRMTDGASVFVNPYDGAILGRATGPTTSARILGYIYQFHVSLVPDPQSAPRSAVKAGNVFVQIVGIILCLEIPIGLILWWRSKRTSIDWKASWFRVCFDSHRAIGVFAAIFLFIAAFTGVLTRLGEPAIAAVTAALTHSSDAPRLPPSQSTALTGAAPIGVDRALEVGRRTMPDATVAGLELPLNPKAAFLILMRVPEETSASVHSNVFVDQYTGKVLRVQNFLTDSQAYRAIRFNRAIHTGDIWGLPSHIFVSLCSLLLVVMVITGFVIWWKKLAV